MRSAIQQRVFNRRPLALLAVCLAAGIVLGRYIHLISLYLTAAAVLAAAAVCVCLLIRRAKLSFALFCAALALLGSFLSASAVCVPYLESGTKTVTGHIAAEPFVNDYGSTVCVLEDVRMDGKACGGIRLYAPAFPQLKSGDVIETEAEVKIPAGVRNPGGFDEKLYLLSEGIEYKAYAQSVTVTGSRVSSSSFMADMRGSLCRVIDEVFAPDTSAVAKGMLLGDKQSLDEDTFGAFRDTGMVHVLAVSGLNAVILIVAVYGFFRLIRLGRTSSLIVTLLFIVFYTFLTGLTPSIVRAAIMAAVLLLGRHTGKQPDTLSSLALAFIISLITSPLDLFMVGFQLSYGAVFGLLTVGAQLKRLLDKVLPWSLPDMISAAIGGTAGTTAVLAASFNRLSLISIVVNVVVLPLASLAMILVFIITMLGLVIGQAAAYLAFAADAVIRLMLILINALAVLPFAAFNVASPPWYVTIAGFLLLFIVSKYLLVSARLKAVLSGVLAAAVTAILLLAQPSGMTVTFLDVGQGDASYIRTTQGGDYFVDGGPEKSADEVVSFAVRNGIAPDAAFVSHTDDDHFSGLKALYAQGLLKKVYCSVQEYGTVSAAMPKAQVVPLAAGDTVLLDDETRAVVLYPYSNSSAETKNDLSLVLLVQYKNHSVLLAGDISGEKETVLFTGLPSVDIYKAAHHGSAQSSYRLPLSVIKPAYSVVSVGDNRFGHPSPLAMRNLQDYSGDVLTTRQDHAVVFNIGEGILVQSYGE